MIWKHVLGIPAKTSRRLMEKLSSPPGATG